MAKFWLVTFAAEAAEGAAPIWSQVAAPDKFDGWAIEVIQEETLGEFAILLSRVDNMKAPKKLQCAVGFANGAKASSIWRDRGFPLVDAIIDNSTGVLQVRSACFLPESDQIDYDVELISIPGITEPVSSGERVEPPHASYDQSQEAADYSFPATWIRRRQVGWSPQRTNTVAVTPQTLTLKVTNPRFPALAPLRSGSVVPQAVWHGTMNLPNWPPAFPDDPLKRVNRAQEFGIPPFQFDDVEVLGFRLNLDELGVAKEQERARLLNEMIERLNFHFEPLESEREPGSPVIRNPIPDFRYQPASSTIMVELLRYGKMRLKEATPPLRAHDFQSQHELVVRILVGRVDEDAAQAHSPATFVPAIFVDNPWSKIVGRSVQGFDKWMADFCVLVDGKLKPLRPDGRLSVDSEKIEELASIREISLVDTTGRRTGERAILKLDCPFDQNENWGAFERINLRLASRSPSSLPLRWGQDDIRDAAFRRSFARSVIPESIRTLRSVQVSPIGEKELLQKWKAETALIEGTFIADDIPQMVIPDGIATLTLRSEETAPKAWKSMCSLLGIPNGEERSVSLAPGNWYRMRCSLELKIRDGFH
jgi:hypothetical protein